MSIYGSNSPITSAKSQSLPNISGWKPSYRYIILYFTLVQILLSLNTARAIIQVGRYYIIYTTVALLINLLFSALFLLIWKKRQEVLLKIMLASASISIFSPWLATFEWQGVCRLARCGSVFLWPRLIMDLFYSSGWSTYFVTADQILVVCFLALAIWRGKLDHRCL